MSVIKSIARNLRLILSRDIEQGLDGIRERLEIRADRYEEAIDARLETRFGAVEADLERRTAELAGRLAETAERSAAEQAALERRFDGQLTAATDRQEERLGEVANGFGQQLASVEGQLAGRITALDERLEARLAVIEERLDARLAAVDERIEARLAAIDERLEERLVVIEERTDQRLATIESGNDQRFESFGQEVAERLGRYEEAVDQRFDERLAGIDHQLDQRQVVLETRLEERLAAIESGNDRRFDDFGMHLDSRLTGMETSFAIRAQNYEAAVDQRFAERLEAVEADLAARFSEHARAVDIRLDDRQAGMDRRLDERFNGFEKRTDTRLEAHELRIDRTLSQNRNDVIERTDLLLQVFEQRLDRLRRGALPEGDAAGTVAMPHPAHSLYDQIIDWKPAAATGLDHFSADEQEIADYLLSFVPDEEAKGYVRQHMRRYLSTLNRIPPARRSSERLLELGSLTPLAPAIRRFCGYAEIIGNNWWPGGEKLATKHFAQSDGGEQLSIPLHNFNVEADPFPFPDGSFRVILCGELLEHLQRDPLHMLWECNRVLENDGFLILTTPNIAGTRSIEGLLTGCSPYLFSQYNLESAFDQHHREYAPQEVATALTASGFEVVRLETEDVWRRSNPAILELLAKVGLSTELRGDNIFAMARKAGPPVTRYPKELYIN